ncbi:MAG TPA: hypothetical protein VMV86_01435, partial [Methanosarcinales archaeon]|nr:hypothetical protein [Methanosarcinales archaeon]
MAENINVTITELEAINVSLASAESVAVSLLGGIPYTARRRMTILDIKAADTDGIHAAIAGTGGVQEITTAITNPDEP